MVLPKASNESSQDSADNKTPRAMSNEEAPKKLGKNAKKRLARKSNEQKPTSSDNLTNKFSQLNVQKGNQEHKPRKSGTPRQKKPNPRSPNKSVSTCEQTYPDFWTPQQVDKGLKDKTLISGTFRINKNNYRTAYVTHPDGGVDVTIEGMLARNRALESDVVVVRILQDTPGARTGEVVYIKSAEHSRTCVGSVQNFNKNHKYLLFIPRDSRFPRMRVYKMDWPSSLQNADEKEVLNVLYYAKLESWTNTKYGVGCITKEVGKNGDVEVETKAILLENDLDVTPYGAEMDKFYPSVPFKIPQTEISKRVDYRDKCVFTIDPLTAKDLDDALSCEELDNGNVKIGVHISDVSYFLKPDNDLDKAAAFKATSIYMVESVYHMLPKNLCMMCSLLPGLDRLSFSVFWEMTRQGEVVSSEFRKTVINSCTQLAYEHAQEMLEACDDQELDCTKFPAILHDYKLSYLTRLVKILQSIALQLRQKRFHNGALRIDQPKLSFKLNPQTSLPESFTIQQLQDSNKLIEEFMLLANITVAQHLYQNLPQTAFLRAHLEPQPRMLKDLQDFLKSVGVTLNIESSKSIQQSLLSIEQKLDQEVVQGVMLVVNNLCSKAMTRAHYFCVGKIVDEEELRHYALSVDRYTHFTSPIRRYADIVVHRQLAHVLGIEKYEHEFKDLEQVAGQCNKNKYNAKRAGEMSCELYLSLYIVKNSPLVEDAVILDIKDRSIDVIIIRMNLNKRIYYESFIHAKYEPIFNSSKKKVISCNVQWDKNIPQEKFVTEYYQKSLLNSSKAKDNKNTPQKTPRSLENARFSDIRSLKLFNKVKVVVCGNCNNLLSTEAFLLP